MSEKRWILDGLATALVVSNAYWWRRERAARRSLTTSKKTDAVATSSAGSTELTALHETLDVLNVGIGDLAERAETMDRRIRQLENGVTRLQKQYIERWWQTDVEAAVDTDVPFVVLVDISVHDSVAAVGDDFLKEVGKVAAAAENCLLLAVDTDTGRFAVTVGEAVLSAFDASDVADDIAADGGGGAGGAADFAQGGGGRPEDIVEAMERRFSDLRSGTVVGGNAIRTTLEV